MASDLTLKACGSILRELMSKKHRDYAWPFYDPIDAIHLQLLDYYEVITHPMDLGTVRKKLFSGAYECTDDFVSDIRLVFRNVYTYTKTSSHDAYAMAQMLEKVFESLLCKAQIRNVPAIEQMQVKMETSSRNDRKGRPATKRELTTKMFTDADAARDTSLAVPRVIDEGVEQIIPPKVKMETTLSKKPIRKPAESLRLAKNTERNQIQLRMLPKRGKKRLDVQAGLPSVTKKESSVCGDLLNTIKREPAASPESKIKKEACPSIGLPKKAVKAPAASTRLSNKIKKEPTVKKEPTTSSGRVKKTSAKLPKLSTKVKKKPTTLKTDDNKENRPVMLAPKATGAKRGPKPRTNKGQSVAKTKGAPPALACNIKKPTSLKDQRARAKKKAALEKRLNLLHLAFTGFRAYGRHRKLSGCSSNSSSSDSSDGSDSSNDSSISSSSDSSSDSFSSSSSDNSPDK